MEYTLKPPEAIKTGNVNVNREAILESIIQRLQSELKLAKEKVEALESALKKLTQ